MRKLKVGTIGVGYLGSIHVKLLKEIEEAEVVAVYDINEDRAKEVAKEFNLYAANSPYELLEMVDAVTCAVPTLSHYEVGFMVLKNNKHLFMEKPITTKISEAKRLVKEAEKRSLILQVGFVERLNPGILSIKDLILNPMFIEAERLSTFVGRGTDVDVILDLMVHDIDLVLLFKNSKIKKLEAVGVPVITDKIDIANVRIEFQDGGVCNLTASRISREPFRKIRFFQKDTYISVDLRGKTAQVYIKKDNQILPYPVKSFNINPLKEELRNFVRACLYGEKVLVDGREAIKSLSIALRIKRVIENNLKRIKF
ncbi:MAG: Gfo/Idh/MocA family oxidoreductase [Candidatus Hydrothermales bacterium]